MKLLITVFLFLFVASNLSAQSRIKLSTKKIDMDTVFYGGDSELKHFTIYNISDKGVNLACRSVFSSVVIQVDKNYLEINDSTNATVQIYNCNRNIFPTKIFVGASVRGTETPYSFDTILVTGVLYKRNGKYEEFWDNGNLKSQKYFKDGNEDGKWTEWYENGQIQSCGEYSYMRRYFFRDKFGEHSGYLPIGTKIGTWLCSYENGNIASSSCHNEMGQLDGLFTEWYKNGNIKSETEFQNGRHYGVTKKFYDNGKLSSISYQINDTKYGEWKTWYKSGNLRSKITYDSLKHTSLEEMWYENGNLKYKKCYVTGGGSHYLNGKQLSYYENGTIESKTFYVNGRPDGVQKTFYDNGQLKAHYFSKKGEPYGRLRTFYANGNLRSRKTKIWDETGKIIYEE
jgi:antitoxin component YwqK of YwqJK toxin-antitoxin module